MGCTMTEGLPPKRPRRILLADDNEVVQEVVSRVAEKHGHKIIRAITGAGAFELAAGAQPDLIVLDIEFPDADGRDVLAKLKADKRTAHIPVVVWSGREGNDSDSRISLDLGAEDYVQKSDAHHLIAKLERVLLRLDRSA
jgi:CheY-like chemotaxis protein